MVLIAANQDTVFKRLAAAMGRPGLADDERYATHSARGSHQEELDALIAEWSRTLDSAALVDLLNDNGVPTGHMYRASEMLEDAHFKARQAIIKMAHAEFGEFAMQNVAPKLSDTPGSVTSLGPALGEHNEDVYRGLLGLDDAALQRLSDDGVI